VNLFESTMLNAWQMLLEAAPYIWIGLLAAGVLHVLVPKDWVIARLGGTGPGSVWKAALLGVPLPLCSCGVIPAAASLRKQGAGRGATLSFLISTPETSIDSLALTYALLGPVWTVIRPVAAVLVAVGTGLVANLLPDANTTVSSENTCCALCSESGDHRHSAGDRLLRGWRFVFGELLPDIGWWLLGGILVSGLLLALLPPDFLAGVPGGPLTQMVAALAIGIPLYICASASTPLAAALLAKGLAPGAAFVLLLAGPATNLASAFVIARQIGRAGTAIYFAGVALGSLLAGAAVQWIAPALSLAGAPQEQVAIPGWAGVGSAALLVLSVVVPKLRRLAVPAR
jgi:hypothetical protein